MAWRKVSCLRWILVVLLVIVFPLVFSRPQEASSLTTLIPSENVNEKPTETPNRAPANEDEGPALTTPATGSSRNVKKKAPVIGESIKMVASQLLENLNATVETPIVADTRIPPKLKNQLPYKNKVKVRLEDNETKPENSHAGVAVPVTLEELETENTIINSTNESSTTNEGISTWILLSNPPYKDTVSSSTEPTKAEDTQKKQKPSNSKNKTKRPSTGPNKSSTSHPIIASIKSDLVAGGSAINDNVLNKIKDTVLSNVQKNKNTVKTKTTSTTEASTTTVTVEALTSKKEIVTKAPSSVVPVIKVTSKPTKKKNKNKQKLTSTTAEPSANNESALMPMEPKEQEIELEVSTPATTTKKPKRTSTKRKKNKTKKRKTSSTKTDSDTALEVKTTNKTKSAKPAKKPESPITTQIYNYLSREVMPSVGVGVIGLAGLVGLASYFFYPFATPVRRTFEVDKKDDIYRHNAEEYANEGNGQAEEEMLGTVLAGMPAHSKNRLNPYIAQTTHSSPMYSAKKDQDIRYRHVAANYDSSNYNNMHYPQQKTGIAHAAVYTDHINYNNQNQDSRHNNIYTTESKYSYDKTAYTPYPVAEPVFAVSQADTSDFGNEAASSVVYGVKPSSETDFKPVYPFEGQVLSETTNSPATYPPTSMYLGSNGDAEGTDDLKYMEDKSSSGGIDNKFVVGNVPKDFVDSDTPVVVPEHGPRSLNRKKREVNPKKRSITGTIEQVLKDAKLDQKDVFMSNEIDEALGTHSTMEPLSKIIDTVKPAELKTDIPNVTNDKVAMFENQFVESVSTVPLEMNKNTKTTTEEPEESNEIATTTQSFRVYEVFSSTIDPESAVAKLSNQEDEKSNEVVGTTTEVPRANTETTTDSNRADVTSTLPPLPVELETKAPIGQPLSSTQKPRPPNNPNVITYPPLNEEGGFFTFLRRLVEFKYRLGLSILQTTSESLNRYLRNLEKTA